MTVGASLHSWLPDLATRRDVELRTRLPAEEVLDRFRWALGVLEGADRDPPKAYRLNGYAGWDGVQVQPERRARVLRAGVSTRAGDHRLAAGRSLGQGNGLCAHGVTLER